MNLSIIFHFQVTIANDKRLSCYLVLRLNWFCITRYIVHSLPELVVQFSHPVTTW